MCELEDYIEKPDDAKEANQILNLLDTLKNLIYTLKANKKLSPKIKEQLKKAYDNFAYSQVQFKNDKLLSKKYEYKTAFMKIYEFLYDLGIELLQEKKNNPTNVTELLSIYSGVFDKATSIRETISVPETIDEMDVLKDIISSFYRIYNLMHKMSKDNNTFDNYRKELDTCVDYFISYSDEYIQMKQVKTINS